MKFNNGFLATLILMLIGLNACKKEDEYIPIWYLFKNHSDFDVTLKSRNGGADIILKKGDMKDVPTKYYPRYDIIPSQPTTKVLELLVVGPTVVEIYSYDYKLEYIVEGTAEKADIEFINNKGVTESHQNVSLPAKYQFKTFCDCGIAASAKRVGSTGNIKISLYQRSLYKGSTTSENNNPAKVSL